MIIQPAVQIGKVLAVAVGKLLPVLAVDADGTDGVIVFRIAVIDGFIDHIDVGDAGIEQHLQV